MIDNFQRLQKVIANSGLCSRRQAELWISQGRITVNGLSAKLGMKINKSDQICLDGIIIKIKKSQYRVFMYNKRIGELTTKSDSQGRPNIFEKIVNTNCECLISVGRLDLNTKGLILITNYGELAHRLMHPSYLVKREYTVCISSKLSDSTISTLLSGITLKEGLSKFDSINLVKTSKKKYWYNVSLHSGRNREVRRLLESQYVIINELTRIRYGTVMLDKNLSPGHWKELNRLQVIKLTQLVGLTDKLI